MAGDADSNIHCRDSKEQDPPPPPKKPKIGTEVKEDEAEEDEAFLVYKGKKIARRGDPDDPKCIEQRDRFYKQFEDSEGYDVDWDSFDYIFGGVLNFHWTTYLDDKLSKEEVLKLLIQKASEEHDEEYGTKLEFVKYEGANIVAVKGLLYYITFWAKDLNSSNQDPKPYQAKVCRFAGEIEVVNVRSKPTK